MFSTNNVAFLSIFASVIFTSSDSESELCSVIGQLSADSLSSLGADSIVESVSVGDVTEKESQRIGDCTFGATWNLLGGSGKRILPLKIRREVTRPVTGTLLSKALFPT